MQPARSVRPEYLGAFREIVTRIESSLHSVTRRLLPVRMIVAGGAALHLWTGARVSRDIDAMFSRPIALPENLEVSYRDADGGARVLYLDRQYSSTLSLMHEDAEEDSRPLKLSGVDPQVIEVRLLAPVDLAVSKLSRFVSQDREDIATLARHKLLTEQALRVRADQALSGYVGAIERVRGSLELACRIVADTEQRGRSRR